MPQSLIYILLLLALVLPVVGAIAMRMLVPRLTLAQLYGGAALIFGVATASMLLLAGSDTPSLQIGNLSVLLPVTAPDDSSLGLVPAPSEQQVTAEPAQPATTAVTATAALVATAASTPTATPAISATVVAPTTAPTEAPTATPEPTAVPPTAIPPTEAPAAPAGQRKYVVKPGDTLLTIAEKFDTTVTAIVKANKLTPEQADALRIGQELIIP
jgi:LysM repeat protein